MEIEAQVQALESEFKLMKGELKQALTDVRDFLITFPVPTISEDVFERFHEMRTGMGGGGSGGETPPMVLPEVPQKTEDLLSADLEVPGQEEEPESQETPEETEATENLESPEDGAEDEATAEEPEEALPIKAEADQEIPPADAPGESKQPTPHVNLLTNLLRWVSVSKREIGAEQLPAFLEVYGQQGQLSPELKQLILQLAEVIKEPDDATPNASFFAMLIKEQLAALLDVRSSSGQISPELKESIMNLVGMMAEPTPKGKPADVWSRLILELHGIISYGDSPIPLLKSIPGSPVGEPLPIVAQPETPPVKTTAKKSKARQKSMKLKLIMPVGKGQEKEFTFHLDPKKFGGDSTLSFDD